MKIILSLALFSLTFSAFARPQICSFEYQKEGSTLGWTAFKTPKKVGVPAKFSDFTITAKNSKSIKDLLSSATFSVNSMAIDSGDKGRDVKIAQFFFKTMLKGTKITGKVISASENMLEVQMEMNGALMIVPMTMSFDEKTSKVTIKGTIDVVSEFGLQSNLAELTKACFEKHEGKTWPDVNLELVAAIKKSCK